MTEQMTEQSLYEYLRRIPAIETAITDYNEATLGVLLPSLFENEICYVKERGRWFYYDGRRWTKDEGDLEVMRRCKAMTRALVRLADEYSGDTCNKVQLLKNAKRLYNRRSRENIIRDARDTAPKSVNDFDANPLLLNCENGTYDLESGTLREHCPSDYLTKLANVHYEKDVRDEKFDRFLCDITCSDHQLYMFLKTALGYGIAGSSREECLFMLYGATTRNGKSTLMESVMGVLGDYARASSPETIALRRQNTAAPSEDLARLKGVRFVSIAEPDNTLVFNASRIKTLTGGDTINARFLHENSFDFKPEFKLYINTNHLPSVTDVTLFASGRIHVIPFERHFNKEEQDKSLKEYFAGKTQRSAILNFLLEGYRFYRECGLPACDKVLQATEEYRCQSDKIKQFLNEKLTPKADGVVPIALVYEAYREWCLNKGYQPLAQNKLSQNLKLYGTLGRSRFDGKQMRALVGFAISNNTV